jgi:hypothetical protein
VIGVVTAERGRVGHPDTVAIDDGTAGILVRLPKRTSAVQRGILLDLVGVVAEPYGQREIRPAAGAVTDLGPGPIAPALPVVASAIGEAVEGRLVSLEGQVSSRSASRSPSGDIAFEIHDPTGKIRIVADASAGVDRSSIRPGASLRVVGVVGQRATRKGRLDGYRVWLRDPADVVPIAPAPGASASADGPAASPSASAAVVSVARAILAGGDATVEATVIAGASLLDATGRRIVVADSSAGIEVVVPSGSVAPTVGVMVRVSGAVGRAYGAPRLRATAIEPLGRAAVRPIILDRPPGPGHEWRLVRLTGTVIDVRRLGDRWRAELRMAGGRTAVIDGLAGARIDPTRVAEGRRVTLTGIVRRPYTTSRDRRFAVVPRSPDDIVVLGSSRPDVAAGGDGGASGTPSDHATTGGTGDGIPDVDLARLDENVGRRVRVGGLIVEVGPDGFVLDDGTAAARISLEGEAAVYLALLEPTDAINVTGVVRRTGSDYEVATSAGADIARVGGPGLTASNGAVARDAATGPADATSARPIARRGLLGLDGGLVTPLAGLGSLAAVSFASILVTLLRRRRTSRRLAARVIERLAALSRPTGMA